MQDYSIANLYNHKTHEEAYKYIINKVSKPLEIDVEIDGEGDIIIDKIQIQPLSIKLKNEFADIFEEICEDNLAEVTDILNGLAVRKFTKALQKFLITKRQTINDKYHSAIIEYNGEPMQINDVQKNIFENDGNKSAFVNIEEVYAKIVDYFIWQYCFFLQPHDTVTGAINHYLLALQPTIKIETLKNEMQLQALTKQAIEQQIKENTTTKSQKKPKISNI